MTTSLGKGVDVDADTGRTRSPPGKRDSVGEGDVADAD
jgi:hypothetical protein